jgi:nucleoside-diphosphate-sugar epimerase
MIKVTVTGANGFIGRHVIKELSSYDVEVNAIAREYVQQSDLPSLEKGKWIFFDLNKQQENAFNLLGKPDILIHLAWQGLPNYRSRHHFESELPLQYSFLKNLVNQGLNSLFVTGTCFEYGMQSGALAEDIETRPDNPYGFAKDTLRKQLEYYKRDHPFNLTWGRLFYLFGEGQSSSSLFPLLEAAVKRRDTTFNMSGGEQLRDYLSVKNVAKAIVKLALKKQDIGPINICSGQPQSVRAIVEKWLEENHWSIKLNLGYYPYPDYESMAFWGDATKIKSMNVLL